MQCENQDAGQLRHPSSDPTPFFSVNEPVGHAVHVSELVAPSASEYSCHPHFVHLVMPVSSAKEPAGHGGQFFRDQVLEAVPRGHGTHPSTRSNCFPGGQAAAGPQVKSSMIARQ